MAEGRGAHTMVEEEDRISVSAPHHSLPVSSLPEEVGPTDRPVAPAAQEEAHPDRPIKAVDTAPTMGQVLPHIQAHHHPPRHPLSPLPLRGRVPPYMADSGSAGMVKRRTVGMAAQAVAVGMAGRAHNPMGRQTTINQDLVDLDMYIHHLHPQAIHQAVY